MSKKSPTLEEIGNLINENLADFRTSLNQDLDQRFDDFAEKYNLSNMATKQDLEKFATKEDLEEMEKRQNEYLSSAVADIVDTIDETNKQHLIKYHHVSL